MERIGGEVRKAVSKLGPAGALPDVVRVWPDVVGEQIARNAWPARIGRDGTLHVAVSSATWAFELSQLAGEIATRLQQALGEEAPWRLRFAPGPIPERSRERAEMVKKEPRELSPDVRRRAERLASGIADEELREKVAKAVAESLARPYDDRPVC
jgi:hypothetical protein